MTLQPESGVPSFYMLPTFRPGRNALLYGVVLSVAAFCIVTLIFNYGITETLWSYQISASEPGLTSSSASLTNSSSHSDAGIINRFPLSQSILQSLEGIYFSQEQNRSYLVTVDDNKVFVQIDHQPKLELVPVSEDTLYAGEGFVVKFTANQASQIDHLDVFRNGQHFIAQRQ